MYSLSMKTYMYVNKCTIFIDNLKKGEINVRVQNRNAIFRTVNMGEVKNDCVYNELG